MYSCVFEFTVVVLGLILLTVIIKQICLTNINIVDNGNIDKKFVYNDEDNHDNND